MEKFWVNGPNPDDRTIIRVSKADGDKIRALPRGRAGSGPVQVRDYISRRFVRLVTADCGLSCACALAFVPKGRNPNE